MAMNNNELLAIVSFIERERGVDREIVLVAIEQALQQAARRNPGVTNDLRHTRGVLSMAAFFDKAKLGAAPEAELCRNDISLKIKNLIANETHPMSDSEIAKSLEADGIRISRRTVAKYREEMHIPSSSCRVRIKSEDSI